MSKLLQQIPEPTSDPASILAAINAVRRSLQTLTLNAAGKLSDPIFALATSVGRMAALNAATDTGADATVQFSLDAPAAVLLMFSYTSIAASAAGNLIVAVDGADLVTVPLAITGGNAYPQTAFTFIGNLGPGLHSASVRASTGITGFSIAAMGSTR